MTVELIILTRTFEQCLVIAAITKHCSNETPGLQKTKTTVVVNPHSECKRRCKQKNKKFIQIYILKSTFALTTSNE